MKFCKPIQLGGLMRLLLCGISLLFICLGCSAPEAFPTTPPSIIESYDKVLGKTIRTISHPVGNFQLSYTPVWVKGGSNEECWIDIRFWSESAGTLQNGILYYSCAKGEIRRNVPMPQIVNTEPIYIQQGFSANSYLAGTHITIRIPLSLDDLKNLETAGEFVLRYPRFTSTPIDIRITNFVGFRGFTMPTQAPSPVQ
jgi:hypothetical protein